MVRCEESAPYGGHNRSISVRLGRRGGEGRGLGLLMALKHLLQGCHQGTHPARLLHIRVQHHPDVDGVVLVRQQTHQAWVLLGEEGGEQRYAEALAGGPHQHQLGVVAQVLHGVGLEQPGQRQAEHRARKDRDRDVQRKQRRFQQVEEQIAQCEATLRGLRAGFPNVDAWVRRFQARRRHTLPELALDLKAPTLKRPVLLEGISWVVPSF